MLGELLVSWWNGGGRLVPRIEVNPELKTHLATKPDIYIYGDYKRVSFSIIRAINISPLFIHQNDNSSLKWVDLDEICEDRWNRCIAMAPLLLDG